MIRKIFGPARELSGRVGGVPFDGIREPVDAAELSGRCPAALAECPAQLLNTG